MRHKRLRVKKHSKHGIELEDEVQNPEVDSSRSQNGDRPPTNVNALEIIYAIQNSKKQSDFANAGGGIYSEVTSNKVYSEGKVNTKTTTASDGQVITGMYNLVAPLTPPVKSASEIIESAAYACVQVHSDEVYATPGELDSKKQKASAQLQPQVSVHEGMAYAALSDATEGEPIELPQMYADIQVREIPAVPTKSSDLQEYLDTNSALNVSVHSEPINPSDFTRNRKKGRGNDPQFLGPVYPLASALPESYQDPAEVTSGNITEKKKQGTGKFGEVVLANTNGLSLKTMSLSKTDNNPNILILVAVKKLQSNPSQIVKSPKKMSWVFPVFIVPMGDLKNTQAKCYYNLARLHTASETKCLLCISSVLTCSELTPLGGCLAL